ncbi:MAG TPA: ComEC/Rec2 family competence protein [Firmicutes bacterium]|nr:ComEC/Rec2 family competence protein [Bacillota bacterium]
MSGRMVLPAALAAYAAGILLAGQSELREIEVGGWAGVLFFAGILLLLVGSFFAGRPAPRFRLPLIMLLLAGLGFWNAALQAGYQKQWTAWLAKGSQVSLYAYVPESGEGEYPIVHPRWICLGEECRRGSLPDLKILNSTAAGCGWQVLKGRFYSPQPAGNPGEYDGLLLARRDGLAGSIWVQESHPASAGRLTLNERAAEIRRRWQKWIIASLPGAAGRLTAGIVLGGSGTVDEETRRLMQDSGMAHLTAVSGLHVSMVTAFFAFFFCRRRGWRSVLTLVPAGLFVLVSGARASAIRAWVSSSLFILGAAGRKKTDPWTAWAAAGLFCLTVNPVLISDIGAVLSFSAVAGILTITRPAVMWYKEALPESTAHLSWRAWRTWRAKGDLWLVTATLTSIGAQIGSGPFVAATFNVVSVVGPVANLAGVPLSALVMAGGLAGCLAASCGLTWLSQGFLTCAGLAAGFLLRAAAFFARLPGAVIETASPSPLLITAYWLLMVGTACWLHSRRLPPYFRPLGLRNAAGWWIPGMTLICLFWAFSIYSGQKWLRLVFFDVGQGDAILIQAPGHRNILVDAGSQGGSDYIARLLASQLSRRGVRKLDVMVSTHPHSDHMSGMAGLLSTIEVPTVWESGLSATSQTYQAFRRAAAESQAEVHVVGAGDVLRIGELEIAVLWPGRLEEERFLARSGSLNRGSVVLRLNFHNINILLMGDAPAEVQERILPRLVENEGMGAGAVKGTVEGAGAVTIWKVPHQGAKDSFHPGFWQKAAPALSVISVGPNSYGHPDKEVLARLAEKSMICRTDRHGAIYFTTDGRRWWIASRRGRGCLSAGTSGREVLKER